MNRRNVLIVAILVCLAGALLTWALIPRAVSVEMASVTRGLIRANR